MILALICSHPRNFFAPDASRSAQVMADRSNHALPTPVKATLIVVPRAILPQWIKETRKHAPHLACAKYTDCPGRHASAQEQLVWLMSKDVIIVTYDEMQSEMKRSSPILSVQWWRVVLDEAQMVPHTCLWRQSALSAGVQRCCQGCCTCWRAVASEWMVQHWNPNGQQGACTELVDDLCADVLLHWSSCIHLYSM